MIIQKIFAEEIFNAQSLPTIQCTIQLENGIIVKSSIPSCFPTPKPSMPYLYDTNNKIVQGRMQNSIKYINETIIDLLMKQPINALEMDSKLMDLHASQPDVALGSNTTLVVSLTLFKAQAAAEGIELFQLIQSLSGTPTVFIPQPLTSIFEFRHHDTLTDVKEVLAYPAVKNTTYEQQLHAMILLHHHTKKILDMKKHITTTSDYGSFVPAGYNLDEILGILEEIQATLPEHRYNLGLNIAADEIFDSATSTYRWQQKALTSNALINEYQKLVTQHPSITYLQDSLASSDTAGWQQLTQALAPSIYNSTDQIFGTNPMKIRWGIIKKIGNMVAIKPEYISTMSQTLAAIDACKNHNKAFLIIGDNFGTHDTFVSDLAVGTGATFLKAGAPSGSEHMAKYNRLLEIERILQKG